MRKSLLDQIQCPVCQSITFDIAITSSNDIEIREGSVTCQQCHRQFLIESGIIDLLINPSPEIVSEQKGWTALGSVVRQTDELMLSLPDGIDEHVGPWTLIARNFHHVWRNLSFTPGETVLDLGAGRCWVSRFLVKRGCKVTSLDILRTKYVGLLTSDIYIEHDQIYFDRICGSMNDIPLRSGTFDTVLLCATLHHSSDLKTTLAEAHRLLKPNGRLLLINEPVVSLRHNRKVVGHEIDNGINENLYWLHQYLFSMWQLGFRVNIIRQVEPYLSILERLNGRVKQIIGHKPEVPYMWLPLTYIQMNLVGGNFHVEAIRR